MDIPIIHPPKIKKGEIVAIVAPAGPIKSEDALNRSVTALEGMGFRIRYDDRIFQSSRYLAGDDAARAEELMCAFEDESVKAIIGLRGGYGCSRLIPHLDKKRIEGNSKLFMGFSDLTTLQLFLHRHFGWITIHGPMALNPGVGEHSAEQQFHILSLWTDPEYLPLLEFPQMEAWRPGRAEGRLVGGCLSNLVASIGTPYEIETEGKILLLEDVGEPPYRLDRMITQLYQAGKLKSLAGILLGNFYECEPAEGNYSARDVLKEILQQIHAPIIANFPAGHGPDNWAIPLGIRVEIDAEARSVRFLEPAIQ